MQDQIIVRNRRCEVARAAGRVDLYGAALRDELGEKAAVLEPLRDRVRILGGDGGNQSVLEMVERPLERFGIPLLEIAEALAIEIPRIARTGFGQGVFEALTGALAEIFVIHDMRGTSG